MPLPPATAALQGAAPAPAPGVQNLAPSSLIRFETSQVTPPSPLYLTVNDKITVVLSDFVGGATVFIDYQYLLPNGELHAGQETFKSVAFGAGNLASKVFFLPECFLIKLNVLYTAVNCARGQSYVRVFVTRPGSNGIILLGGYISQFINISWPYSVFEPSVSGQGFHVTQAVGNPAAGADISFGLPSGNLRGRMTSLTASLLTSASVANRVPLLVLNDGTRNAQFIVPMAVQAASTNLTYCWDPVASASPAAAGLQQVPIPANYLVMPGWLVKTVTNNIQAADQWSSIVASFEQWVDF